MSLSLRGFLTGLAILPLTLWLGAGQQGAQDRKTPKLERPGKFVRDVETCGDCHEEELESIRGGLHDAVPDSPLLENCETCHGPGELHSEENEADQITHPARLPQHEQRALCARCHAAQIREHGGPLSEFEKHGKTCSDCHAVHQLRKDAPGHGDTRRFMERTTLDAAATPVGAQRCVKCHGDKLASLDGRTHASLRKTHEASSRIGEQVAPFVIAKKGAKWHEEMSCEACHGNGSLHAAHGIGRWITRPDLAKDGDATCRACHAEVDPVHFHWKDDPKPPLLSSDEAIRCTTCHKVHEHGDPTLATPRPSPDTPRGETRRPTSRPARKNAKSARLGAASATEASAEIHALLARVARDSSADTRAAAAKGAATSQKAVQVSRPGDAQLENRACLNCHRDAYDVLKGTTHEELGRLDLPPGQGCVSCHPGAAAHAANGGAKDLVVSLRGSDAAFVSETCNQCHGGDRSVCGFSLGAHGKAEIGCLECHSPAPKASSRSKLLDANKTCQDCHPATALSFRHANRHPIGEGLFHCSSCHDAHAPVALGPSSARRMSRKCADCHKEFRGPFVFQHHADKGQGCLACHMPHGSPNRKLLDKIRARDNCLSCHGDLPSFHDLSPGSIYQNCLDCHVKIHGSNRNRFFFK